MRLPANPMQDSPLWHPSNLPLDRHSQSSDPTLVYLVVGVVQKLRQAFGVGVWRIESRSHLGKTT